MAVSTAQSDPTGPSNQQPVGSSPSRSRRALVTARGLTLGGLIVAAAVGWLIPYIGNRLTDDGPVQITSGPQIGKCASGWVFDRPMSELPLPRDEEDYKEWGQRYGGHVADELIVAVSIDSTSDKPLVITDITVDVTERAPAYEGNAVFGECGGGSYFAYAEFDLDEPEPRVIAGSRTETMVGDPEDNYVPIEFPWIIDEETPGPIGIYAGARDCTCSWTAEIFWSVGGESGSYVIDDDGKPFTIAPSRLSNVYYDNTEYDPEGPPWATNGREDRGYKRGDS